MGRQLTLFGDADEAASFTSLAAARTTALACTRCALAATRRQVVFGEGAAAAGLMVVGEGPSEADDASGHPFSGPSGRLLEQWLAALGLRRADVWLTNVVRCRPAARDGSRLHNRPPRAAEIAACRPWLAVEQRLVGPAVVLGVGATAGRALVGAAFEMAHDRGRWLATPDGTPTLVTYNPAYVLRLEGEERRRAEAAVAADLAAVRSRLGL
jgi:uracil-DNA glycosylase family protein